MILKFNNQWLEYDKQTFCNFAEPVRYVYTGANVTATPTSGIYDTNVDLTHTTPQGYDFVDYSVTGATLHDDSFKIGDTDVYVEGNYRLHVYTITTQASHGTISVNHATGVHGDTITISNTPATGYDFDYYEVIGATLINNNQFVIGYSNVTVIGHFKQHIYTVTTQSTNGSVTASPASGAHGTTVTLSNTPASGYAFDYYEVIGATLNNNKFTIGYSNVTVIGHFKSATKHATVHLRLPTIADTLTESGTTWYPYLIGQTWVVVSHTGDDISELTESGHSSRIWYADGALGGNNSIERFTTGTILRRLDNVQAVVHATGDSSDWAYEVRARSNIRQDVIYLSEYNGQTEEWGLHQVNPRNTQDAAGCWNYGRGQGVVAYTGPLSEWWQFNVSVGYNIDGNKYCMPNPTKSYKDVIVDLTWT